MSKGFFEAASSFSMKLREEQKKLRCYFGGKMLESRTEKSIREIFGPRLVSALCGTIDLAASFD